MKHPLRIGVVGGSIGGLTTAVLLNDLGHEVAVFERSPVLLEGRGAGIVVLPMTERYFTEGAGQLGMADDREVALTLTNWSYINQDGEIIDEAATHNRFTAWNTLYRALLDHFGHERYRLDHKVKSVTGAAGTEPTIEFANGETYTCDLVIGADGMGSTIRSVVSPATTTDYAGYVAWRGTIHEKDLSPETRDVFADSMIYQVLDHSHILAYAIPGPGDSIEPGRRSINFVWYRNTSPEDFEELMTDRNGTFRPTTMPPGFLQDAFVAELNNEANRVLAPPLRELVDRCPDPFIQVIFDMAADQLVFGRTLLLGDAASVLRPHVAAGTAKACADAWALRDHLADSSDLETALSKWEDSQLAVARTAVDRSRAMGESAQTLATMVAGDPDWRFGLFGPGN